MSLIFIFLDGVGLAPAGPDNPLASAPLPALQALLGGPLTLEQAASGRGAPRPGESPAPSADHRSILLRAIDATLGVPGLPQSGTGQTALFAGFNAAALHGRHQPHFPPVALRPLLAERSVFRRVGERGGRAAFANAFGDGYWQAVAARRIRRSASVIAAEGAGIRFRDEQDLRAGLAVPWDITGAAMRRRGVSAPPLSPEAAGATLVRLAGDHQLVFFETFLPDLAGHGRWIADDADGAEQAADGDRRSAVEQIHAAMARIDGLLGGVLAAMRPEDTLLVTSDHGNVESLSAPAHTRNPVPLLAVGPGAPLFAQVTSIAEVADVVEQAALASDV